MSSAPFFSVLIPCYNRSHSVTATLRSVAEQTFIDYECLVIDDGSRDGEALRKTIENLGDARFKYVRQDNTGAAAARNKGIDLASGAYVAFLDSDDFYLPNKLQTDFDAICTLNDPNIVVFSQVLVDRGVGKFRLAPKRAPHPGEKIGDYLIRRLGFTQTSTLVVERVLARKSLFTPGLPMAQDFDFPIRLEANGASFHMKKKPSVIWMDIDRRDRVSNMPPYEPMLEWADKMRPQIGNKAYYAFRASQISRLAAPRNFRISLVLLMSGLIRFSMPPKLALKSIIQVLFPRSFYRKSLDFLTFLNGESKKTLR